MKYIFNNTFIMQNKTLFITSVVITALIIIGLIILGIKVINKK